MKLMLRYMYPQRWRALFGITIKLFGALFELMIPFLLEWIIDDIVPTGEVGKVLLWSGVMLIFALLSCLLGILANRNATVVTQDSIRRLRRDLFQKTMQLSGSRFDTFSLPTIITRMTTDSYNVQTFMGLMQRLAIRSPITLFGGILMAFLLDAQLSLLLIAIVPLLAGVVVFVSRHGAPMYRHVQELLDNLVRIMRENISGIRVVKALSKTDHEEARFGRANDELMRTDLRAGLAMALPGPSMNLFLNVGLVFVVVLGAYRVNNGVMQPGVILAFLSYFQMILSAVMGLNSVITSYSKSSSSASRIARILGDPCDQPILEGEAEDLSTPDHIVFRDVTFTYPVSESTGGAGFSGGQAREASVKHISFTVKRGGSLGIIGGTGSGKTTLLNLLMRFYDADCGEILVDGKDVRSYAPQELRSKFGVVFQHDTIFHGTVAENIRFGREVTEEKLRAAAADAMIADFIESQPEGYERMTEIRGANLSGGQKQRLLIARALAGDPEILVLDDSSSALDYRTDAMLRANIRAHYAGTTTVTIAQRVSSVRALDHILVLDEGHIIGSGTHEELLQSCSAYREMYEMQMGELAEEG